MAVGVVALGVLAGVLSGMLGIGGGIVLTPALHLGIGLGALAAVGTSLAAVLPAALAGALAHHRAGKVDVRVACIAGLSGSGTGAVGSLLGDRLGDDVVALALGVVLLWSAVSMTALERPPSAASKGPLKLAAPAAAGAAAGLIAGLVGVGGGFLMVPVFRRFLGMPTGRAVGTSLAAIPFLAAPSALMHAWVGEISWALAGPLAAGTLPGALAGAAIAHRVDERLIRGLLAGLFAAVGAWLLVSRLAG